MTAIAQPPAKQLRRDTQHALLGGVCAGLAEYLGLDIALTRVAYVLVSVFTAFAGILVYVILWVLMPAKEPAAPAPSGLPQQR